jgi:hypothetical protein
MGVHVSARSLAEKLVIWVTANDKRTQWIVLFQMSQNGCDERFEPGFSWAFADGVRALRLAHG